MFTVVIAEKEYIEKIHEYELFLRPFLSSGNVEFCEWYSDEERLADMVPELANKVGRRKEWKVVIICNDDGVELKNPFDLVKNLPEKYTGPIRGSSSYNEPPKAYEAFLEAEHQKKLAAYEEASHNPLTRLVTFFCNGPTVTREDASCFDGDQDYVRYLKENSRKQELRKQILADEVMEISLPTEVYCIARRTYVSEQKEFDNVWSSHTETEYSRFYDRNMYFDKMRYLIFDILPKTQRDYQFDYIRFLYATILLASNDIPKGGLSTERVYRLECENDEEALKQLLQTYEAKLNVTKETLNLKIQELLSKKPRVLSDREAQSLFCTPVSQPVTLSGYFENDQLYADHGEIGLSDGCSQDELIYWEGEYKRTRKGLANMMKQARRAVRRAASASRANQDADHSSILLVNEFQQEDIQEHVEQQELEMVRTETLDLNNDEAIQQKLEKEDRKVRDKIDTRMYKPTTLVLGGLACLAFLLGFFTVFYKNANSNAFNFVTSLLIVLGSLAAFTVIAFVVLFFLRYGLVARIKDFNTQMGEIGNQVRRSMSSYSKYLSHVCNVRRGYGVLNAIDSKRDPDEGKVILYQKHIEDIELAKEKAKEVFGQFMVGTAYADHNQLVAYDFNFDYPNDYQFPLPYTEGTACKIGFIQPGVSVRVPVEFVKSITVRREELYE